MNCYLRTPDYADHLHSQTILFLTKARHDRFGENKAKEIRSLSADSLEVGFAKNVFSFQLHQLIEQLMFLKNQIEKLGEQIVFSGLYVSDEFTATKHKILQTRLTHLWQAIWFAANRAEFCDSILSKYYQLLKARGKHHLTAVGAVTRKLCDMIFTILRKTDPMNRRRQRREIKAYENIDSQRLSQKER